MEGKAKNKLYNVQLSVFQYIETFKRLARKITICFCANKDKRISKLEKAKNVPSKDFVPQIIQSNGTVNDRPWPVNNIVFKKMLLQPLMYVCVVR